MKEELNEVRKAFRYLYQYQRKLIDSIQLLTSEYKPINVQNKFCGPPKLGKKFKFNRLAWDYLPMYQPAFKFDISLQQNFKNNFTQLAIYVTSDTGHFLNETVDSNDKTDLSRYEPTENSDSILILMMCTNDYKYYDRISLNNKMIKDNIGLYNESNMVIAKKYNISNFKNESSIINIRNDFRHHVSEINNTIKIFDGGISKNI